MNRELYLLASAVFCVLIFSSTALSFWDGNQQTDLQADEPSALVVKLASDVNFDQETAKSGAVLTNIPELNTANRKYAVTRKQSALSGSAVSSDDNPLKDVHLLIPETGTDLETMALEYSSLNCVEYAHPNYKLDLYDIPNDSLFSHQWGIHNTGQEYYYVLRRAGYFNDTIVMYYGVPDADIDFLETYENPPDKTSTVVVAIIDTGIDWEHPELFSKMWFNPGEVFGNGIDDDHNGYIDDIYGWNFVSSDPDKEDNFPLDDHGHGTHCAGIVSGFTNNDSGISGITPDVELMAVKIFFDFSVLNACRGIIYAADNGADVINMSWGMCWPVPVLEEALEYAHSRGVVLIASAGNDGDNRVGYPASYPSVISVGATDSDDHVTYFSTYNDSIDLCAPGLCILSLRAAGTDMYAEKNEPDVHIIDEEYYIASGTSMSSPHVVAVAAYMRSVSPGLTPDATQQILESTADDYVDPYGNGAYMPGWDQYSGHGRVNLPSALSATPLARAQISSPLKFTVVSGSVGITGSADGPDFSEYTLEYGIGSTPSEWIEIENSSIPVNEDLLGTLECSGLEGLYIIRLRVNASNMVQKLVFITDEPLADIQSPADEQIVGGEVKIKGSALCEDFSHTIIEFKPAIEPSSWYEIGTCTTPVYDDELGSWNTILMSTGTYRLRVSVYSSTGLEALDTIDVTIGSVFTPPHGWTIPIVGQLAPTANYADVNQDGVNEILMGTITGMKIISTDGTILTTDIPYFPPDDYRTPPAVGKLDNDIFDDIVAVGASGTLYGFPSDGSPFQITLAELPEEMTFIAPGDQNRIPKVYLKDINGDGIDEIHYFPGKIWNSHSAYYFIYNADGSEWGYNFPLSSAYERCMPADLNGDGVDEIYCYGTQLAQFDTLGQWIRSVDILWEGMAMDKFQLEMSAVDIDINGVVELIVSGYFFDGASESFNYQAFAYEDGLQLIEGWPHDLGINARLLASGPPVFGDLDGDGSLEYVMAHSDQEYGYIHAWHINGIPVLGEDTPDGILASSSNPACFSAPLILDCNSDGFPNIAVASGAGLLSNLMIERLLAFNLAAEYVNGYPMVVSNQMEDSYLHMPTYGDINQDGFLDVVYPSDHDSISFSNFTQYPYDPDKSYCPMWRYNRRLNATLLFTVAPICGDANNDKTVNVSDAVWIINYVFLGGAPPHPLESGDTNCDGICNVSDAVWLVNYVFTGGYDPCDSDGDGEPDC
jgi:subtilisin family serine protease